MEVSCLPPPYPLKGRVHRSFCDPPLTPGIPRAEPLAGLTVLSLSNNLMSGTWAVPFSPAVLFPNMTHFAVGGNAALRVPPGDDFILWLVSPIKARRGEGRGGGGGAASVFRVVTGWRFVDVHPVPCVTVLRLPWGNCGRARPVMVTQSATGLRWRLWISPGWRGSPGMRPMQGACQPWTLSSPTPPTLAGAAPMVRDRWRVCHPRPVVVRLCVVSCHPFFSRSACSGDQ